MLIQGLIRTSKILLLLTVATCLSAPGMAAGDKNLSELLQEKMDDNRTVQENMEEAIDDIQWFNKVGDIAYVDKIWQYSTPVKDKGNVLKFHSHVFIPKDRSSKIPLVVFAHGGVYGAFQTKYAHIIRELLTQGYAIIAPEYRGSRGFGKGLKKAMDKGGKELDDIHAARNFMVETFPFIDSRRVGIMGWSMGGFIAAMSPMIYPDDYQVAFSGNPVSNLAFRMSYRNKKYRAIFEDKSLIGKTVKEDPQAYIDRSPIGHVEKLKIPLLIHTTTSDKTVRVSEVQTLLDELKAKGIKHQFKIYDNAPGDHSFERLHTKLAREARLEVYQFLAKILKPKKQFKKTQDLVNSWIIK